MILYLVWIQVLGELIPSWKKIVNFNPDFTLILNRLSIIWEVVMDAKVEKDSHPDSSVLEGRRHCFSKLRQGIHPWYASPGSVEGRGVGRFQLNKKGLSVRWVC
jgi:hypothetical protein